MEAVVKLHDSESIPSREELVRRARAMGPVLRERNAAAQAARRVPKETIEDFHKAGFFKILQPKYWGGWEMDPQVFFDVELAISEACPSTGWVYGIVAVHNFQLGLFDLKAQEDVWKDDPSVLIASSYQPVGKVERVEGGFRFSGRWSFSSGVEHCDWIFLGSIIPPAKPGDPPDMRTFMLPRSDYEIIDTWHTFGLKGTGSQDVKVDNAFVPEYRTHKAVDGFFCTNPGQAVNTAPLFRMPWAQIFVRSISTSSLGAAKGALNLYIEQARNRVSTNTGKAAKTDPVALQTLAKVESELDGMVTVLHRNFDTMMATLRAGKQIPVEERILYRYQSAGVARRCANLIDELMPILGGRGIYLGNELQTYWLDLHAARLHVANDPNMIGQNLGATLMGDQAQEFFV